MVHAWKVRMVIVIRNGSAMRKMRLGDLFWKNCCVKQGGWGDVGCLAVEQRHEAKPSVWCENVVLHEETNYREHD